MVPTHNILPIAHANAGNGSAALRGWMAVLVLLYTISLPSGVPDAATPTLGLYDDFSATLIDAT